MIEQLNFTEATQEALAGPVGKEIVQELQQLTLRAQMHAGAHNWETLAEFRYARGIADGISRVASALEVRE